MKHSLTNFYDFWIRFHRDCDSAKASGVKFGCRHLREKYWSRRGIDSQAVRLTVMYFFYFFFFLLLIRSPPFRRSVKSLVFFFLVSSSSSSLHVRWQPIFISWLHLQFWFHSRMFLALLYATGIWKSRLLVCKLDSIAFFFPLFLELFIVKLKRIYRFIVSRIRPGTWMRLVLKRQRGTAAQ